MSATLYDDAIVNKLQKLLVGGNLKILKPDETTRFFSMKADETKDKITLPMFTLSRKGYRILNKNAQPKSKDGIKIRRIDKNGDVVQEPKVFTLNAIPIQLEYHLDIYTVDLAGCEEYSREFIFQLVNHPEGVVVIPYNDSNVKHKFTIHVEEEVEDNSDIQERLFPSQFSRYTISFIVDDAYLWSVPAKSIVDFKCSGIVVKEEQSLDEIEATKVYEEDKN